MYDRCVIDNALHAHRTPFSVSHVAIRALPLYHLRVLPSSSRVFAIIRGDDHLRLPRTVRRTLFVLIDDRDLRHYDRSLFIGV